MYTRTSLKKNALLQIIEITQRRMCCLCSNTPTSFAMHHTHVLHLRAFRVVCVAQAASRFFSFRWIDLLSYTCLHRRSSLNHCRSFQEQVAINGPKYWASVGELNVKAGEAVVAYTTGALNDSQLRAKLQQLTGEFLEKIQQIWWFLINNKNKNAPCLQPTHETRAYYLVLSLTHRCNKYDDGSSRSDAMQKRLSSDDA